MEQFYELEKILNHFIMN